MMSESRFRYGEFISLAFLAFLVARFWFESPQLVLGASLSAVILGNASILIGINKSLPNSISHYSWLVVSFLGLVVAIASSNQVGMSLPQMTASIGVALALLKYPPREPIYKAICGLFIVFFFYHIVIGTNPEDVFTVSRNFISVLIVLLASIYYIACELAGKKPSVVIALAHLIVTMWAIGRAGMACGFVLFVAALIYKKRGKAALVILSLFLPLILVQCSSNSDEYSSENNHISTFLLGIERIERLGTGGQRNDINQEYVRRLKDEPFEVLFGASLDRISSITEVEGNPHNSYIRLHTTLGLVGVIIFLAVVLASFFRLIKRRRYLTLLVFITCLFRVAFDSAAFHGPLDVIIFYCIFSSFDHAKSNVKCEGGGWV